MKTEDQPVPLFIRRVMPNATDAELQEAAKTFREYVKIVIGIAERLDRQRDESNSSKSSR